MSALAAFVPRRAGSAGLRRMLLCRTGEAARQIGAQPQGSPAQSLGVHAEYFGVGDDLGTEEEARSAR